MKKILSFIILLAPWFTSFILLPFKKDIINIPFLLYFIFISILFYIFITLLIYNKLKKEYLNNNFILNIVLLYFFNQTFNLFVLYKCNTLISIILSILLLISICTIKNSYNN